MEHGGEQHRDEPDGDELLGDERLGDERLGDERRGGARPGEHADELPDGVELPAGSDPDPLELGLGPHLGHEEDDEDEEREDDDEGEGMQTVVTVEISGLSLYTHHGVTEAEREVGQRVVLDIRIDVGESDATETDSVEDTVDYAEVCQLVALVAQQRSYRTLERLCTVIADRLLSDFEAESVWVKASKPEPPIPLPVDEVSVEVWREPGE